MAINIDELQIQIGIEASKASSGLKTLASGLRDSASTIGNAAKALNETTKAVKDLGSATSEGKKSVAEVAESAAQSASKFSKLGSAVKSAGLSVGKFFGNDAIKPFGNFGNSVKKTVRHLDKLLSAIKRIAMYRLIRSAIKMMTGAITEGTKSLIAWDREWGNNTSGAAKTADEIASKWGEVKKAFGAAAMPLIQILQPALMAIMNTVINVVNAINQVLRMFQGFGTYMKATAGQVASSASTASGAAKELQRVLFGFDELNVLPSQTNSGSGSADASTGVIDYTETAIDKTELNELLEKVLEIGAAFGAWKIASSITKDTGQLGRVVGGLAIAASGALIAFEGMKHQFEDGITWSNMVELVGGLATMTFGLGTAFGKIGTGAGLLASGIALVIPSLKELKGVGNLSAEAFTQLEIGIGGIGTGLSFLLRSPLPALISLGVAGLIAGVRTEITRARKEAEKLEIERYGDTIENLTGHINDNTEAIRNRADEIVNSVPAAQTELDFADKLIQKYFDLQDKIELTEGEKEQLKAITQELVDQYPDLKEYYDGESGLLDISREQWKKIYDAKLEDIKLEARREKLIELYKLQTEAELNAAEATEVLKTGQDALYDAIKRKNQLPSLIEQLQDIHAKVVIANGSTKDLTQSEKALLDEYTKGTGKISDLRDSIIDLSIELDNSDKTIADIKKDIEGFQTTLDDAQGEVDNIGHKIELVSEGAYDDIASNAQKSENEVKTSTENTKKTIEGTGKWASKNPLTVRYKIDPIAAADIQSPLKNIQSYLNNNNLFIKTLLDSAGITNAFANLLSSIQNSLIRNPLNIAVKTSTNMTTTAYDSNRFRTMVSTAYASGGIPDVGTLFYAGEAGAEIVANGRSGGTGVMNMQQMQDAVASGNMEVVNALYSIANMLSADIRNKDTNIYLDGAEIGRSVSQYQTNQARRGLQGAY